MREPLYLYMCADIPFTAFLWVSFEFWVKVLRNLGTNEFFLAISENLLLPQVTERTKTAFQNFLSPVAATGGGRFIEAKFWSRVSEFRTWNERHENVSSPPWRATHGASLPSSSPAAPPFTYASYVT